MKRFSLKKSPVHENLEPFVFSQRHKSESLAFVFSQETPAIFIMTSCKKYIKRKNKIQYNTIQRR